MVGFLLPLAAQAEAETEVSLNFFYDNLSDQGNWIEVGDYGYCFQPNVAVNGSDWRPYADGYWAYTDVGWTWVSYEDFGWATYHYGRWADLDDYGWVWVPGYEWAPAWVSWRTGGDYIGWAPLPPAGGDICEGRTITIQVDAEFEIGSQYYNFIDIRYIGEPVLRARILAPSRNVTIINNTVNVTNITYNNSIVNNYGPDYNRLNQYSTRPIQRLSLKRETVVGADFGRGGRHANFNRVNGNQLMVVAPQIQKSEQNIAPKVVKAKVDKPNIEHGWKGVGDRQQVEAVMRQENAKHVPPPSFQPQKGRKGEAAAAGQNAVARPNEVKAPPAPPAVNEQEAANAAPKVQRSGREQYPGQANGKADQKAAQGQRIRAGQPVINNPQDARQGEQRQQQATEEADNTSRAKLGRGADLQKSDRTQQAQDSQRAERARRAEQAQEAQRANRAQQTLQAQEAQRAARAQRSAPPPQPEHAQRRPPNQPTQQGRPPQPSESQSPNPEHKDKKKKPADNPPQP
jgi:hypothetical protein